jgi:hypothetical protein
MWWGNAEQRRGHKDTIKTSIKNMKLAEKQQAAQNIPLPTNSPPSLYHSPSDGGMCRTRGGSIESTFSGEFDFNNSVPTTDMFAPQIMPPAQAPGMFSTNFQPFNDSWKIERQWFVNDVESRRDSTLSCTYFEPLPPSEEHPMMDNWVQKEVYEHRQELLGNDPIDFSAFDFSTPLPAAPVTVLSSHMSSPPLPPPPHTPTVEERDQFLLQYFSCTVAPLVFPRLQDDCANYEKILLAPLETNEAYFHAALSIAASHFKATEPCTPEIDLDLTRHVSLTVQVITGWLAGPTNIPQIIEATLAMIYFRGVVGGLEQDLCELPWHAHFQAARDAIARTDQEVQAANSVEVTQNMTIASWIDILGATIKGDKPAFADLYRHKLQTQSSLGLSEFIGCEDSTLYYISEIATLESYKNAKVVDDIGLCCWITRLGDYLNETESAPGVLPLASAFDGTGARNPAQLSANITHVFRIAARIYLCSLLPTFNPTQPNIQNLVSRLDDALKYVPAGPDGLDRALVWPLLLGGAASLPSSSLRATLAERALMMKEMGAMGAFGRMMALLKEVWKLNDDSDSRGEQRVHWRDVMQQRGWDYLLI